MALELEFDEHQTGTVWYYPEEDMLGLFSVQGPRLKILNTLGIFSVRYRGWLCKNLTDGQHLIRSGWRYVGEF